MHDVEGARFRWCYDVQDVDIVEFSVGDVDECGYVSTQVETYVEFDGCFGLLKACSREERQAQTYGEGIERVNRGVEVEDSAAIWMTARVTGRIGVLHLLRLVWPGAS